MGLNRRASVGPDTQSYGVASMPKQIKRTKQKQDKNKQKQPPNKPNTKTKPQQQTKKEDKRQKLHIDPAGTVGWMMSYASSDGLVWREKPKQRNKART